MNSPPENILVVEDEESIQQLLTYNLVKAGYQAQCADDGETGLQMAKEQQPDLIILDIMLPGINGYEVCKQLRSQPDTCTIPILMLTARSEDDDVISGLDSGADDYLAKPFSPQVLLARLSALLRRASSSPVPSGDFLNFPDFDISLDLNLHECLLAGKPCGLTSTEFAILKLLASRPGWVYSRQQIIDDIRGFDYSLTSRAVDVQISGLRKKMSTASKFIQTIRGVGYRFSVDN